MDKKEKEKREARNKSEKKRRDQFNIFFTELRKMLHNHGYPVKADKSTTLQNTIDFLQKKEGVSVSPGTSEGKPSWNLTFQNYEDFIQTTLQSLDGFLIILSTDGMVIHVDETISSLLGHLPFEVIGKKLLSFLPDEEKKEVHNKITLDLPVSDPEIRIEFCCHFKRGNIECGSIPAYEYVKFIMNVKDVFHGPFEHFGGFSHNHRGARSSMTNLPALPLEEQFFLVGSVCFLRSDRLQKLHTLKGGNEEASSKQNLNEEFESDSRSTQGQGITSGTGSTSTACGDGTLNTPTDRVETKQCGPCENIHDLSTEPESSSATSTSPHATTPELSTTSSSVCSGVSFRVEQEDQVVQDTLYSSNVAAYSTVQSSSVPSSPVASYIDCQELELMSEYTQQLEKKTWSLQADIRYQQAAPDVIKEHLQTVQESKFQIQPTTSLQADSPQPQVSGPVPQKSPGKRTQLHPKKAKRFRGLRSPHSLKSLAAPPVASPQEQQQQEPQLQEEPLPLTKESQGLQLCLPTHTDVSVPLYSNPIQLVQSQPIIIPVQIVAEVGVEQQPTVYYQDESRRHHGDERHSLHLEEQPGSSVDPKSRAQSQARSPGPKAHSSTGFAQSPVRHSSSFATVETSQDYIQLWQQPPDPQQHVFFQVDTWPAREQTTLHSQAVLHQIQAPEATGYQADQVTYFLPAEQSTLDQQQPQQYFHRQL